MYIAVFPKKQTDFTLIHVNSDNAAISYTHA
jgi:hypothetical protein